MNLEKLKDIGKARIYNQDEFIFYQGDSGEEMFIILKGKVNILIHSVDGYLIKVAELGSGDFLGEMSLLEKLPRSASVMAAEKTIVIAINEKNFLSFICRQPDVAFSIMKALSHRIRLQNEKISKLENDFDDDVITCSNGNEDNIDEVEIVHSDIFIEGHKKYNIKLSEKHRDYLFEKEVTCPLCNNKFNVDMIKNSKLRLEKTDKDLRQRYIDFDPLYYSIWVCPHCYYADFQYDFNNIPDNYYKKMKELAFELRQKIVYKQEEEKSIDNSFIEYYMVLYYTKLFPKKVNKIAKAYMNMSWLYEDMDDKELARKTIDLAYEYYNQMLFNSCLNISKGQEQRLYIIIGELLHKRGKNDEAIKFLRKGIIRSGGNNSLNKIAEDNIEDIRVQKEENS